jgi:hypothetical protein
MNRVAVNLSSNIDRLHTELHDSSDTSAEWDDVLASVCRVPICCNGRLPRIAPVILQPNPSTAEAGEQSGSSPVQRSLAYQSARLILSRFLAMALEFQLAADLLGTTVAPSWNQLGRLGAIAVIRTFLNYFLAREIHDEERAQHEAKEAAAAR